MEHLALVTVYQQHVGCGGSIRSSFKTGAKIIPAISAIFHRLAGTRPCLALLVGAALSGCSAHSFPLSNNFVYPAGAGDSLEVFADANGTLYPSGWQRYLHPRMSRKRPGEGRWMAGSLLAQSSPKSRFRSLIERDELRQLQEIKGFALRHKRIFILVHGYNASVAESAAPFAAIESELDLKPGDGVIRFYWDGLIGKGVGAIKVWFNAANDSQLVGSRGLRDVLDQIDGREIYLFAHSRGASVVMSALGNPVHDARFFSKMTQHARGWGKDYSNFLSPGPLAEHGNSLHIVMLAPAIDRIDFCDASEQPLTSKGFVCTKFRALGAQVKSFAYTVNSDDPILSKSILSSRAFNPTGLGYRADVGRQLKTERYAIMQEYVFEKPESFHAFKDYAAHPVFLRMLSDLGIGKPMPR